MAGSRRWFSRRGGARRATPPRAPTGSTPETTPETTSDTTGTATGTTSGTTTGTTSGTRTEDPTTTTATTGGPDRPAPDRPVRDRADRGEGLRQVIGVLAAAHLPFAVLIAASVGAGVALTGRPADEAALAGLAVLVVLAATGLGNDVADVERDRETQARGKPVASDLLPAGNAAFVAVCLAVIAVPLSLQHGTVAGAALLACLPVGWLYNRVLRRTALSPLPWILTSALLLAFVSYGGPGWGVWGAAPTWEMLGAAAAVAVGLHFLTSLPDLVGDNRTGVRHLPLRVALVVGAPRLLLLSGLVTAAAVAAVVLVALGPGLRQG